MASSKKSSELPATKKAAEAAKPEAKPKASAKPVAKPKPEAKVKAKPATGKVVPDKAGTVAKAPEASKAAAPARKTATAAKPRGTKPAGSGADTRKSVKKTSSSPITAEQRRHYIEVAAYYIAERRGFRGGNPAEDWAMAEREIDRLLAEGLLSPTF